MKKTRIDRLSVRYHAELITFVRGEKIRHYKMTAARMRRLGNNMNSHLFCVGVAYMSIVSTIFIITDPWAIGASR
jgi:hypothetical protein